MNPGGGLFGHTDHGIEVTLIETRVFGELLLDGSKQTGLFFALGGAQYADITGGLGTEVQQQGGVAAIVQNHVGGLAVGPFKNAVGVVPVVLKGLTLCGEDRNTGCSNGCCRMVLSGEDVARGPPNLGAEGRQGLDEDGRLNRHVQGASDAGSLQRLRGRELLADGHEAGHLGLGDANFFTSPVG